MGKVALVTGVIGTPSSHDHAARSRRDQIAERRARTFPLLRPLAARHDRSATGSVVVVVTIFPHRNHHREVLAALENAVGIIHSGGAGCELYALHEGEDRLVIIQKWDNSEAFADFGGDPELAGLRADLNGLLSRPIDVQVLRPHPAGTVPQGAL